MMRILFAILFAGIVSLKADDTRAVAFAEEAEARIEAKPSVRGNDEEWFFLTKELRHIATGEFWTKPWDEVAANGTDPVESIVEFNAMLNERGIELLLVPVPAKAAVYPEKFSGEFAPGDPFSTEPFLELIRKEGIEVLDLESRFRSLREQGDTPLLYCRQDAHFSPVAAELIAGWIAEELDMEPVSAGRGNFTITDETSISITGDQIAGSEWEGKVKPESLQIRRVLSNGSPGVEPENSSSILLLGDSHTLVFHQGAASGMHTTGAGVFDHLAHRAGFPLALVGVRGSGLVQARKQLFYTATSTENFWETKEAVVWMFSVREFTQSTDRIIPIPLDRP